MNLKVENVSKKYKNNVVLKNFNYEFKSGLYLFVGVNGSGKTTTLKLISNIIKPTNINYYITKLKVAYLCEKFELGNQKVFSFLKSVKLFNLCSMNIKEEMKKWQIPNKYIGSLSKGNKQKCGIIMMKMADCDVYLFDEPTDALDKASITLFREFIKELILLDKIVIISTHEKDYFKDFNYKEVSF